MNSFNKARATVAECNQKGVPILSVDTKKKEFIGQFYRAGKSYCQEKRAVYDHDLRESGRRCSSAARDLRCAEKQGLFKFGKEQRHVRIFV